MELPGGCDKQGAGKGSDNGKGEGEREHKLKASVKWFALSNYYTCQLAEQQSEREIEGERERRREGESDCGRVRWPGQLVAVGDKLVQTGLNDLQQM